jgi:trans-aconitate methyltransferase
VPEFDTSVPHIARVYDYWLGGKDNFAADRELAQQVIAVYPNIVSSVRANRAFLARAVRFMVAECGITQFLDLGTGIPTAYNTHEVAQRLAPSSRIVYVDNDPIVLSHAQALLKSDPAGECAYIDADLRDPATILDIAARTLDFTKPVGVMLIAAIHFVIDDKEASAIVDQLMDACPPGSCLAITHAASDINTAQVSEMTRRLNESAMAEKRVTRDLAGVTRLFGDCELVEPGVVRVSQWRPDSAAEAAAPSGLWGGVARKSA